MRLFLASLASQSLDQIYQLLPADPASLTLAYIPTAANTYTERPWAEANKAKLIELGFKITEYELLGKDESAVRSDLSPFDCIFVEGGNTFYLLKQMRKCGFDKVLPDLLVKGTVYIGSSAGSIVMGPSLDHVVILDHPEEVLELKDYTALGLIDERIVPHFGREKYIERHAVIKEKWDDQVTFLSDSQVIMVNGDHKEIVG